MKTVRSQVGVVRVGRRERDLANLGTCCGDGLGGRVIGEIARVLRSSGLLLFDEEARCMLGGWVFRTFTEHPCENRFEADEFAATKVLQRDILPPLR
jgi:hypothetical protein